MHSKATFDNESTNEWLTQYRSSFEDVRKDVQLTLDRVAELL